MLFNNSKLEFSFLREQKSSGEDLVQRPAVSSEHRVEPVQSGDADQKWSPLSFCLFSGFF